MEDKIKLHKMWKYIPILVWKDDLSLIETRGQLFWLRRNNLFSKGALHLLIVTVNIYNETFDFYFK